MGALYGWRRSTREGSKCPIHLSYITTDAQPSASTVRNCSKDSSDRDYSVKVSNHGNASDRDNSVKVIIHENASDRDYSVKVSNHGNVKH